MNDLEIKSFANLSSQPFLVHGFSTRKGGYSREPHTGLNLGLQCGDQKPAVHQNRKLYFDQLGVPADRLVFPEQVHSPKISVVERPGIIPECDALITNRTNLFLTIQTADCIPVFIYDPQNRVVAIIHSGWRGTAENITAKTVERMQDKFQSEPSGLLAAIGPGVQQNCYQVDDRTAAHFEDDVLLADGPGHFKLDVAGAVHRQLTRCGVPGQNIEQDKTCTHCASEQFYSYRRDGKGSGRMMGIIGMRA